MYTCVTESPCCTVEKKMYWGKKKYKWPPGVAKLG